MNAIKPTGIQLFLTGKYEERRTINKNSCVSTCISSRMPGPKATHLHASRIKHVLTIIIRHIITIKEKTTYIKMPFIFS